MPIIYSAIGTGVSVGLGIFYFRYLSAYSINKTGIGKEQVKEAAYEEAAKLIHERNYEQLDQLCKNYTVVKDSFNILDD